MKWPANEPEFVSVMKALLNDVFLPAATEQVKNEIYRDINKIVEDAVRRKYQEQVADTNDELARALTAVIELLARRQSEFVKVSEGL